MQALCMRQSLLSCLSSIIISETLLFIYFIFYKILNQVAHLNIAIFLCAPFLGADNVNQLLNISQCFGLLFSYCEYNACVLYFFYTVVNQMQLSSECVVRWGARQKYSQQMRRAKQMLIRRSSMHPHNIHGNQSEEARVRITFSYFCFCAWTRFAHTVSIRTLEHQPYVTNILAGNIQLSAVVIFSGASFLQVKMQGTFILHIHEISLPAVV